MQPNTSYMVCFTPRSGSTLLCEMLYNTGIAGQPDEYFEVGDKPIWEKSWGVSTSAEYLVAAIKQGTTPNGVFGTKIGWSELIDLADELKQRPEYSEFSVYDRLNAVFPNLHYIWIKRENKVRQAISLVKAKQTGIWTVTADSSPRPMGKPAFSFQLIDLMAYELEAQDAAWERYFKKYNIQPFVVVYEELVANPEKTALQILRELGIPTEQVTFAPNRLKQQADAESEEWVQRYYNLKTHSKWHCWLSSIDKLVVKYLLQSTKLRAVIAKMYLKLMHVGNYGQHYTGVLADKSKWRGEG
jgi:trehalose 2-sulfotransferase